MTNTPKGFSRRGVLKTGLAGILATGVSPLIFSKTSWAQEFCNAPTGDAVTLGLRPEDCLIVDAGSTPMTIRLVERLGDETLLEVNSAGGELLVVKAPPSRDFRVGETVGIRPRPGAPHVFDAAGNALPRADRAG